MKTPAKTSPDMFNESLIAPCGMNCGLCIAFLRVTKPCPGCNGPVTNKSRHCIECQIKHCPEMELIGQKFCFACEKYPCARMLHLDNRYRTKYGMSMVENLGKIQNLGIEEFVNQEIFRWTCPDCGGTICVHRSACIYCGRSRL
jgi:hypothetical protein